MKLALTFDYGQRAAKREIAAAEQLARHYHVSHHVMELAWLKSLTQTALVQTEVALPRLCVEELDDRHLASESARKVWVPNRNGVFIQIAAAMAESRGFDQIIVGFNREEGATFPDNSREFLEAAQRYLQYSTLSKPRVVCYTLDLYKWQIVQLGRELNLPFEFLWSCYEGGEKPCGMCESCLRLTRALEKGMKL